MDIIDQIAEARIQEALERGELSNLPGEGKPLNLEDDSLVPEELRVAYRLLKNAGFLPAELQIRKEITGVEQLLGQIHDTVERSRALSRLEVLRIRLAASRQRPGNFRVEEHYYQKLLERLEHHRP
jgi:hypothetical protein